MPGMEKTVVEGLCERHLALPLGEKGGEAD